MNIWDIGVNKALYEVLPLLARVINPLVLVNLLDLARDPKEMTRVPELMRKGNKKYIMSFCSRCHYYARIAGLGKCKVKRVPTSVPVATHKDQVPRDVVKKVTGKTEGNYFC